MPLINTTQPENAEGTVAEIYREINEQFGFVLNVFQLDSINPDHLARHWHAIKQSIQHPSLSQKLFALVRLLISESNSCVCCIVLNTKMLIQLHGMHQEQIAALCNDSTQAPLDEKEKALLLFVLKTVKDSNGVTDTDTEIEKLKAKGCSEREIFDALAHGSQQMAGDIMLNAFKVEADLH